ncbi:hypothetical protein P691DRAFT_819924 [Macrolepiota fuliginosa MF-IS2]|uniref:Uncharacterized protein n=1 Tax=Macrolepiota fuliginosa MF-IS2 TaxID=1400762 RepID=A0A9P5WZ66_9AGAR|nr:hypothetical protein P691DRAFT_819924 [Macrolepiota fuliginosa MF-IS2]
MPSETITDLEEFIRQYTSKPIDDLPECTTYWSDFSNITHELLNSKVITEAERDLYFWFGLSIEMRRSLAEHLALANVSFNNQTIPSREAAEAAKSISSPEGQINKLVEELHKLNVEDSGYAVTYAHLVLTAPEVADRIQPPVRWSEWNPCEVPPENDADQQDLNSSESGKKLGSVHKYWHDRCRVVRNMFPQ